MPVDTPNPFAPPALPSRFSHTDVAMHGRALARWLRFVGILYYLGAGIVTLAAIPGFVLLNEDLVAGVGFFIVFLGAALYLGLHGHWLCCGATSIREGVEAELADAIAAGLGDVGRHFALLAVMQLGAVALGLYVLAL